MASDEGINSGGKISDRLGLGAASESMIVGIRFMGCALDPIAASHF